jgi:hypothetical protein
MKRLVVNDKTRIGSTIKQFKQHLKQYKMTLPHYFFLLGGFVCCLFFCEFFFKEIQINFIVGQK